ncbi:MAG: ATP-dependent RNA helicase RhlE [bacterium ADurb.Bin431]|nr:MAG: ATP-dependent RNA helicase RhlE [bacterium ADurb.Bin431]
MSFAQFKLDSRLNTGIKAEGYVMPTPVQSASIPVILRGDDMIGTAQTGTGKTAAFVLPILHRLLSGPRHQSRALILTPTRELAEQIHQAVNSLSRGTGLRSATIYGGVPPAAQIKALRSGVEILVACPGRLLDHLDQRHADLSHIEFLVLDEADRMLDMGFMPSVRKILQRVPERRQTLLFSATFPEEIETLARQSMRRPARQIGQHGYRVTSLHSDRTQSQRQAALQGFRRGDFQIMVATDIAARGLDVESISHVINFDMPDTADAYIHRIGRTGRAERSGDAYTMTTSEDNEMVRTLEKIMGKPLPRQTLQNFDYQQAAPPKRPDEQRPQTRSSMPRRSTASQRPAPQRSGVRSNHPRPAEQAQRSRAPRAQARSISQQQAEPEASTSVIARWGRTLRSRRRTL